MRLLFRSARQRAVQKRPCSGQGIQYPAWSQFRVSLTRGHAIREMSPEEVPAGILPALGVR